MNGIDSNGAINGKNIINETFNELTIRKFVDKPDTNKYKSWNTKVWVHCECSCGKEIKAPLYGVVHGLIKSCGHLRAEKALAQLNSFKENNPPPNAVYLTHDNKTMNITEWSKETGIPRSTITYRMDKGMPPEKVLERKVDNE